MLGLGFLELVLIFFLLLILFGPKELPGLARLLLHMIYELKTIFNRLEREWKLNSTKQNSSSHSQIDTTKNEKQKKSLS